MDKNEKKVDSFSEKLKKLYKSDTTLEYLKNYEDDRKKILSTTVDDMQLEAEQLKKLLSSSYIEKAFSTENDYKNYSEPILGTINQHNYNSLQKLLNEPVSSYIKNDYKQTIKATELLSNKLNKLNDLGLAKWAYYDSKLDDSINLYTDNKLEASEGFLSLASTINSDLLKKRATITNEKIGALSRAFEPMDSTFLNKSTGLAGLYSDISKNEGLNTFNKALKSNAKSIKIDNISINPPIDFKPIEIPRIQDFPTYKQNEKQIETMKEMSKCIVELRENQEIQSDKLNEQNDKFLNNSHKQIDLMTEISGFLSFQTEILELQRKNQELQSNKQNEQNKELLNNSHEQVKLTIDVSNFLASQSEILEVQKTNQELQNEQLKKQNEIMEKQIEDNEKSSSRALLIAWAGIAIAILTTLSGMYLEHYIYMEEDKSDSLNHTELKKAINENNYKDSYSKLIEQLILQNKNLNLTNQYLKNESIDNKKLDEQFKIYNQYFKNLSIENKKLNKLLKIQNTNLIQINKELKKNNKNLK